MPAPQRRDLAARLVELTTRCRAAGLAVTPQRLAIFRALMKSDDHPSPEALHRRLRVTMPTLSLATVYKTLDTLEELGLVEEVSPVGDVKRYDGNDDHHHHLVCMKCKKVVDFYDPDFDALSPPRRIAGGFVARELTVQIKGICADCQ